MAKTKKKKNTKIKLNKFRLIKSIVFFAVIIIAVSWVFWGVPLPTSLDSSSLEVSTKIFDRNDKLLMEIYADKRRTPVNLDELPDYVKEATIAIEDKDFYNHYGFDVLGIVRGLSRYFTRGQAQGGSTLTQQLVKNALLTPERTIKRKAREFALSLVVETIYSKDKILELYLNQIPYGSTAYGIEAASDLYFGKSAKDLSLAEAALLAGLPQRPTAYSPFGARPELAKGRQETVLNRMVEDGYISQEEADKAKEEELTYATPETLNAPHFALWVKEQLAEEYGDKVVEQGGLRVKTTLDLELQEFAQAAVATEVAKLKSQSVGNGAAIVTKPSTGEILAMVGSKDYNAEDEDGKVNIAIAERQPGSSIKPLNYALAIEEGLITASTPIADIPTCFTVAGQAAYCPRNYDGSFHGAVQTRFALANSYNIPAVRVLALNSLTEFISFANDMGISTYVNPDNYGLSITLGGGEVKPLDMATAFGVFANGGIKQPLVSILKVEDWTGKVYEEAELEEYSGERVLDPGVAFIISDILKDNSARAAAFGTSSQLRIPDHPEVSVKTGTTNNLRDNWTVGYSPLIVTTVWVGNNDNTPMSSAVSGVSGASPIWHNIMSEALDRAKENLYHEDSDLALELEQPDNVSGLNVCTLSGNVPGEGETCETRFEYFLDDFIGARIESGKQALFVWKDSGAPAPQDAPQESVEPREVSYLIDPLGSLVCTDCNSASQSATIGYPLRTRN